MKKIKIAALMLAVFTLVAGCGNTSKETSENTQPDTKLLQSEIIFENEDSSEREIQNTTENNTENVGTNVLIKYI